MTKSDPVNRLPRVIFFVPQYPYPVMGGLERQSHNLSKALTGLGLEIRVLSEKITPEQPDTENVEGVSVTRMRWFRWRLLRFLFTPFYMFIDLWRERDNYDVIHLHQHSWIGLYLITLARLLKKPILTKLPNVGELGVPGMRKQPLGPLRLALFLRSSGIVAMSEVSVQELLDVGYPRSRILKVPNGIEHFPRGEESSGELEGENSPCRVVFAGRLVEQKRLDVLLAAWAKLHEKLEGRAILELWGEGPLGDDLKRQCKDLGIAESVVFAGHLQDVASRLRSVDIFVLPSMVEGNSNAVLEAMEAGLPVVATPVGGTPMQVGPEGAALLFPVGDHEALAEKLISLVLDPDFRKTSGQAMHERIGSFFDLEKVATSYFCAYRTLAFKDDVDVDLEECAQLPSAHGPS